MITFFNSDHALHQGQREMFRGEFVPCFEVAGRVERVLDELRVRGLGKVEEPPCFDDSALMRVHTPRYMDFLRGAWDEWLALGSENQYRDALPSVWPVRQHRSDVLPTNFAARMGLFSFDVGTPLTAGTWQAARSGGWCALSAAARLLAGDRSAFALTRPPGHHAGPDFFGGYCFINNAALAAQTLRDGGARRVAILDIDYHHGNGTQCIFYDRPDVFVASIHGDPRSEYPFYLGHADEIGAGAGLGCNLNLPLPPGTDFLGWREAFSVALHAIVQYRADAMVVSLGVDTFEGDPISSFRLRSDDFLQVGEEIARTGLATAFVLEGGYAVENIGVNVANVLDGFGGRS